MPSKSATLLFLYFSVGYVIYNRKTGLEIDSAYAQSKMDFFAVDVNPKRHLMAKLELFARWDRSYPAVSKFERAITGEVEFDDFGPDLSYDESRLRDGYLSNFSIKPKQVTQKSELAALSIDSPQYEI